MAKVLTFDVNIKGLEDSIWRVIEINDSKTLADLAYTILASFDSLAYHMYYIKLNGVTYACSERVAKDMYDLDVKDASRVRLCNLKFNEEEQFVMEYDSGSPTIFEINYLGERGIDVFDVSSFPIVIDGGGRGMIDDVSCQDLVDIVNETDDKGYSTYFYTPGYEREEVYDYRFFDIKSTNRNLKGLILEIKDGYEVWGE